MMLLNQALQFQEFVSTLAIVCLGCNNCHLWKSETVRERIILWTCHKTTHHFYEDSCGELVSVGRVTLIWTEAIVFPVIPALRVVQPDQNASSKEYWRPSFYRKYTLVWPCWRRTLCLEHQKLCKCRIDGKPRDIIISVWVIISSYNHFFFLGWEENHFMIQFYRMIDFKSAEQLD